MRTSVLHLREDTYHRALSRGQRFKHNYMTYESLGHDRASGRCLCVRIEGRNQRSEPIEFRLLQTRQPRRTRENWRMYG